MPITLNGTTGITNDGGYTGDGISFADTTPANTLVTTTGGNVGIGTSSPLTKLHVMVSDVTGYTSVANDGLVIERTGGTAALNIATDSNQLGAIWFADGSAPTQGQIVYTHSSDAMYFGTSNTERMRIDSTGDLLLGTSTRIFDGKFCIAAPLNTRNSIALQNTVTQGAGNQFVFFANSAGNKAGSIDHTGTTTVAYTTSSDYRMKENVQPMVGALDKVSQLNPVTYNWKEDGSNGQGFIAHELQAVVPDCVTGEKDAVDSEGKPVYQGIDTSFLVATLTAAIQELKAELDSVKAELAALKA
jgi:hypothetical protein